MTKLIDSTTSFEENTDGLVIQTVQEIPQRFLDKLKEDRFDSKHRRSGEYVRVASIPTVIVDKWLREGYDFHNESVKNIVAKLKMEGLDAFLTTDKQIG